MDVLFSFIPVAYNVIISYKPNQDTGSTHEMFPFLLVDKVRRIRR